MRTKGHSACRRSSSNVLIWCNGGQVLPTNTGGQRNRLMPILQLSKCSIVIMSVLLLMSGEAPDTSNNTEDTSNNAHHDANDLASSLLLGICDRSC